MLIFVLLFEYELWWRDVKIRTFDNAKHRTYVDLKGEVTDKDLVERKIKEYQIDVVISAIGGHALTEQLLLVEAIKAVGNIKRFLPSEFGHDISKANLVEPAQSLYDIKRKVRRVTEDAGIPYTYICCNSIAGWPYFDNNHPCNVCPPLDQF